MTASSSTPEIIGRIQLASIPTVRCSSGSTVRKAAPSTGPMNSTTPPTTAMTRPSTAAVNENSFGSAKRVK